MIFYRIGELCQQYAVNYSRRSIAKLIDIQPQKASLFVNDELVMSIRGNCRRRRDFCPSASAFPLTAWLSTARAIDVSALTGESLHRDVSVDDEVLSGSINIDGNLKIKVTKPYKDSMVAKILHLVENASSLKAKSENFISKFARYYTPTVVALAFIIAIVLPFVSPSLSPDAWEGGFKHSIKIALIFLVVSCPCALVISIPWAFRRNRRQPAGYPGEGSNYLETLNNVAYFVFDKTGTLTSGKFVLSKIITFGHFEPEKLLELGPMPNSIPATRSPKRLSTLTAPIIYQCKGLSLRNSLSAPV